MTNVLASSFGMVSFGWGTPKCHDYNHWDYQAMSPVQVVSRSAAAARQSRSATVSVQRLECSVGLILSGALKRTGSRVRPPIPLSRKEATPLLLRITPKRLATTGPGLPLRHRPKQTNSARADLWMTATSLAALCGHQAPLVNDRIVQRVFDLRFLDMFGPSSEESTQLRPQHVILRR